MYLILLNHKNTLQVWAILTISHGLIGLVCAIFRIASSIPVTFSIVLNCQLTNVFSNPSSSEVHMRPRHFLITNFSLSQLTTNSTTSTICNFAILITHLIVTTFFCKAALFFTVISSFQLMPEGWSEYKY